VFCRNPAGDKAAVAAGSAPILSTALATFY
jgi:hypothetical protein